MRRIRLVAGTVLVTVVSAALTVATAAAAEPTGTTLVVDRDRAQCASAGFTSIQAAVDAAQPGDLIRVCPDLYPESVVIDKPLTIKGDPDAVEAIDCFAPTLGELPGDQQVIVDPAGDGFSIAFKLEADDIVLEGLVVQGASVGVDASDRFSGYRIDHNLIRQNGLFGMDVGSQGTRESRVDHNCLRDDPYGLVSELDDDSLWKPIGGGPERDAWNARDLINARIDHNSTFRHGGGGLQPTGPGRRIRVTIDHNLSREDLGGILLQNSIDSAILDNDVIDSRGNSIQIGGGTQRLLIAGNRVRNAGRHGIVFFHAFLDEFPIPSHDVVVTQNHVTGSTINGLNAGPNNLADSLIFENITNDNSANGIILSGSIRNLVRDNQADGNLVSGIQVNIDSSENVVSENQANNNGIGGISAISRATANRFEHNSMHGNGWRSDTVLPRADARDLNPLVNGMLQNVWIGNDCDTDIPAGMICSVG